MPHHNARHGAQHLHGLGVVYLRDGRVYRGEVDYDGVTVTVDGQLRVVSGPDSAPEATYRRRVKKTWPLALVREIVWQIEEAA